MQKLTGLWAQWTLASAVGGLVGSALAMKYFPGLGFVQLVGGNLMSQQLGFAFLMGLFFGFAQSLVLATHVRALPLSRIVLQGIWMGVSSLGLVAMTLPFLLIADAAYLHLIVFVPFAVIVPAVPGLLLLAAVQWLVFRRFFSWNSMVGIDRCWRRLGCVCRIFCRLCKQPELLWHSNGGLMDYCDMWDDRFVPK